MKSRTVIVSAVLHLLVFALALTVSKSRAARRATQVAVVGDKKKKLEPKKEEKPRPKPKPLVASARPDAAKPQAEQRPVKTTAPENAPPEPVESGMHFSNDDGPGLPVLPPPPSKRTEESAKTDGSKGKAPPLKRTEKTVAPKVSDNPEEDTCTDAPSKPVALQKPTEIEYTQEARANGVEGRLVLRVTVGADGSVIDVEVVSKVDPQLDAAAVAAVKTWVFKPSMRCGKAVGGISFTVARTFELGD
jgi:periplasmic protein TonB